MRPKLGIIAGGGRLPAILIENCQRAGRDFVVVALKEQADAAIVARVPHIWARLGAAGTMVAYLKDQSVAEIILAGSVRKPAPADLRPDLWTAKFLARGNIYGLGDDELLTRLVGDLERREGFRVVGVETLAPDLLAAVGQMTRAGPSEADAADIRLGADAARELGRQDRGQGVVVADGKVLAHEGVNGTDAMLAELPDAPGRRGILVKTAKPGQERRADLPTIGPETVRFAAAGGLRGIAVEAGSVIIVDRGALVAAAERAGIFVIGISADAGPPPKAAPLVYLIAGEPSADILGQRLMAGLKAEGGGNVEFAGIGGPGMHGEGMRSLFPMEELAVMGLAEVVPRIPALRRRIQETAADIRKRRPDVVVGIDSPDFNFRVAKRLKGEGIPLVHFVAPSVWAWRPGRARKIAGFLDHLLALLPFEPPYFEKHGLPTTYVGHPILESGAAAGDGAAFRAAHGIGEGEEVVLVLFGSRLGEARRHLPVFKDVVKNLHAQRGGCRVVTVSASPTHDLVANALQNWPGPPIIISDADQKYDAFAAANVAVAASGTVSLELAMAGVPSVIAYRMNRLTGWLAKRLVGARFANLINLVLDRPAVPEFLLDDCTADRITPAVAELLKSEEARRDQRKAYDAALRGLGRDDEPASRRAARTVLKVIGGYENAAA